MSWAQIVSDIGKQPGKSFTRKKTHKTCKDCDRMLPVSEFYRHVSAYRSRCKVCYRKHLIQLQENKKGK